MEIITLSSKKGKKVNTIKESKRDYFNKLIIEKLSLKEEIMWGKAKDPICGVRVKKTTPYSYELNGKTFYFDSAACRQTFIDDSKSFLGGGRKEGFIQKLSETSDGKRKTCH